MKPTIWFEAVEPAAYRECFEAYAHGIRPGGLAAKEPFHQLELADAVLAGGLRYDAAAFDRAPRLLIIARTGIGYDRVDIPAASARHIAVVNAPDAPTVSTAEHAITLMLAVARNVKGIERELAQMLARGEQRSLWGGYRAFELAGKRLGLVGLGRIGGHVSGIARALGMQVAAYDPFSSQQRFAALGVERMARLEDLLAQADVLSLNLPLNAGTSQLMNAERFAQMKAGAIFINVSRGGHVDEAALAAALDRGHLFGAGLDVTDPEPPQAANPLLERDNVIITPHIASATIVGKRRLVLHALEQVLQVLRGERPPHLLNPEVWDAVHARWEARQYA